MPTVQLFVADAAPLITLAVAQSLDLLRFVKVDILIPDAVFHEATAAAGKIGAQEIIDWYRAQEGKVRVEPTEIFQQVFASSPGQRLPRDRGERAALEVVRSARFHSADDRAIILSDDRDIRRIVVVDPDRVILLSTSDYLGLLEQAGLIQSAKATLALAQAAVRNASERGFWDQHDPDVRSAVRTILKRPD